MTITEFLLARIAEDKAAAEAAAGASAWRSDSPAETYVLSRGGERLFTIDLEATVRLDDSTLALAAHAAKWLPGRVLEDLEVKRRIVGDLGEVIGERRPDSRLDDDGWEGLVWDVLCGLALPYSDHSDYHEEWRP